MKGKSTKSALLMSFTSLLLCFAMLIGCTFAWFTDSVTSGVNKIQAGNLDVEVSYKDGNDWKSIQDAGTLFSSNLWEPGHTEYVTLKVENKGTLALKYQMNVSPVSESGGINMAGQSFKLSDYLVFKTIKENGEPTGYTRDSARTAAGTTMTLKQAELSQPSTLLAKASDVATYPAEYITLVVYMPESVGNEANYKTGTKAPEIDLGITVVATQLQNESDSFGTDYDKDAAYDADKAAIVYNYFPQVSQSATVKKIGENVTVVEDSNVSYADGNLTIKSSVKVEEVTGASGDAEKEFASVQLPVATINALLTDENDHVIALNVNKDDTANATFKTETSVNLTDKETVTYEVNVTRDGVKVANTENLYTVKMFIGENKQNLVMYHNNTEMSKVTDTPDANNEYNYTPANGYVTMCVNSFSPFTSVYDEPVAAIGTTVYYTLKSAIDAAESGAVIKILKDIDNAVGISIDTGKAFTVDFNGHTYTVNKPGAGSTGTQTAAFQLIKNQTITFKNGTINASTDNLTIAQAPAQNIMRFFQSYANVTFENMTIDGTNIYGNYSVIEFANGTVNITGNTSISAKSGAKAINVDTWRGAYPDGAHVTINTTGTIGDILAYAEGTGTMTKSSLTIQGGTFGTVTGDASKDYTISITGGTFSTDPTAYVAQGCGVSEENGMYTVIGSWLNHAAASFATPVDTTNKIVTVADAEELALFAKDINKYPNYTVKLTADIDLSGKIWTPISSWNGTFDGQNHTIKGMYVNANKDYGNGFFSMFGTIGTAVMKDVTFDGATVQRGSGKYSGNVYGIVAGYTAYYGTANFENVNIKNSMVWGFGKVGAIAGMSEDATGSSLTVKNCSVSDTTVKGAYNCAGFIGLVQGTMSLTGCVSSNITFEHPNACEYLEISASKTNKDKKDISGLYWKYDDGNLFAGWSEFYNDYYNWNVYKKGEESVSVDDKNYDFDGYCHNVMDSLSE